MRNSPLLTSLCMVVFAYAGTAAGAPDDVISTPTTFSAAALVKEVNSLQVEEVAWRQIDWKTCLVDGLQESQATKKPLMLWVFIDRPIDDERC